MKIPIYIGYISQNTILMKLFVILPDVPEILQPALNVIRIIGDLPIVPSNHKFLAQFHPGTLRIMDLMS